MQPFLSRTRVSITLCPTTSCLCSSGFSVSSSTSPQRKYLTSAFLADGCAAVRFRATCLFVAEGPALRTLLIFVDDFLADRFFILKSFVGSAIHQDRLPGDVRRTLRSQPDDGVGNLPRFGDAL